MMTEQELIDRCVNDDPRLRLSEDELLWFHDLIRTRPDLNRLYENVLFQALPERKRSKVQHALHYGPFQDMDNLNSTGSVIFGDNGLDALAFSIIGSDRHGVRPWLSHRPYQAFPQFVIVFSVL